MNDVGFRLYATDDVSGPAGRARSSLLGLGGAGSTASGGITKLGLASVLVAEQLAKLGFEAAKDMVGVATSSIAAARQFQSDMTLIQTQAGASASEVTNLSAAVLKLAPQVGTGPDELAAGLYHIESAGLRGAKAMDVLTVAAEGAKVGHADLESVTNALIAANQSGVKGVEDMSSAMGTLNAIVGAGNMRMQDLTDAMGTGVLSTAKNYGVTIQSVGAALADMTDQGIPATDAATRLNSAMRLMAAPTTKAIEELKSIGITQTQLATDMRGPGGIDAAVHDLKDHLDKSGLSLTQQAALIAGAFGGKQSGAILTLIGNVDLLDQKVTAVNAGASAFGDAVTATADTVQGQQDRISASFDALKIQLGQELLPVEQRVMTALGDIVSSPAVQQGIVDLGQGINDLFSPDNIASAEQFVQGVIPGIEGFANNVLPPLIEGLKVAGQITKEAFDLFNQLPEPLKAAIIGGLAVNKLSGGLIGSGIMDLGKVALGSATGSGGGGIVGALGVQHVFVDNWEMMRGGGNGPSVPGNPGGLVNDVAPIVENPGVDIAAGGAIPELIAAGTGLTAGGAALGGAIMAAGLIVDGLLANGSIALLGKGKPQAPGDRVNPINGQTYGPNPTMPQEGGGYSSTWLNTPTSLQNSHPTDAGDAHIATVADYAVSDDPAATAAAAARWAGPAGAAAGAAAAAKSVQAFFTQKPVAAVAPDAVTAFFNQKVIPSMTDLLSNRDTSATDMHNAALSLDAAVNNWRNSAPPIPNVTVNVNTTVSANDVTTKQTKRTWYGGGYAE